MGKKKKNTEKLKMPMEAEEEVDSPLEIPPENLNLIYKTLKKGVIAFCDAVQGFFPRETEEEMGKEEEQEEKKMKKKNKNKKKKNKKKEESEKVEECKIDDVENVILSVLPPEREEQVEYIKQIVKEMKTEFTGEEIYNAFRQCNMDPNLVAEELSYRDTFEQRKTKWTKKKERIYAPESKSQFEVGSSSGILKQGGSVEDDAGRTDPTHNDTVQSPHEADGNQRSQLDNFSSTPAAAESSVASQLPSLNIGKRKGKEIVQSMGDNTADLSRSPVPPLRAVGPLRICAPRHGSDPRAPRNNVARPSRNDSGRLPTALCRSSTPYNPGSGDKSIRGPRTFAEVLMPPVIPDTNASEAGVDAYNRNPESTGTLERELLPTSSESKIHADETDTQHEVDSSSIVKQGGHCDDDAGRTDTTHDDTVQGLQDKNSSGISQFDNVSSPPAAAVSPVASQLHGSNMGKGKGKEVVESVDDKTAVISRSDLTTLHAEGPPRLHAELPYDHLLPRWLIQELGHHPPESPSGETPSGLQSELPVNSVLEKIHADETDTQHEVDSSSIVKQGEHCDDDAGRIDTTHDDTVQGLQDKNSSGISQFDNVSSPPAAAVSPVASQLHGSNTGKGKGKEVVESVDDKTAVISRSNLTTLHAEGPPRLHAELPYDHLLPRWLIQELGHHPPESPSGETPSGLQSELPVYSVLEHALLEDNPSNPLRRSIQSIRNDSPDIPSLPLRHIDDHAVPMMYRSMERPTMVNAPPFTPSASTHQSLQTLLQGNNLSSDHTQPSSSQPPLALQHGHMNGDGNMHQNFGYDMTSPQQEWYQGSNVSQADVDPSGWQSFPGRGSTPHRFLPYSPAPSDDSGISVSPVQAQHQHRNNDCPIRANYNFAARNSQHYPGAVSTVAEQQQHGWVPPPSDRNYQHSNLPSAQQEVYRGNSSSQAHGIASGRGSFQGTGRTYYPSQDPGPQG